MAIILQISYEELEKLRALVLAKYRSNPLNPAIKINSYKPNYTQLLKDIQNSVPQCSESAGLSRLVKLLFFTNPSICEPSQMKPASFGSDFIDCCYLYATNGTHDRDSFLTKHMSLRKGKIVSRKSLLFVLALIIVFSFGYFILTNKNSKPVIDQENSIAVFPFVDMSPEQDQAYLGKGIAEELITKLSFYDQIKVIAPTSSFALHDMNKEIQEIGEILDVSHILEGSVRKSDDRLRITAQLVDAKTFEHIWANNFDLKMNDIFLIQDQITKQIVQFLAPKLGFDKWKNEYDIGTESAEAYDYCLKGIHLLNSVGYANTEDEVLFEQIETLLNRAIENDPQYAEAYGQLAILYAFNKKKDPQRTKVKQLLERALLLNPTSNDVLSCNGLFHQFILDWDRAHYFYSKQLRLHPHNPYAYRELATLLFYMGLFDEADSLFKRGLEIDPLNSGVLLEYGDFLCRSGRKNAGFEIFEKAKVLGEKNIVVWRVLLSNYCSAQDIEKIDAAITTIESKFPNYDFSRIRSMIHAAKGDKEEAMADIQFVRNPDFFALMGMWDEYLNEQEKYLEGSKFRSRYMFYKDLINIEPEFIDKYWHDLLKPLNNHPRFPAFLEKHRLRYIENVKNYSVKGELL